MVQWKIAWRELQRHPGRALLTLLSVVIGVAAVLAIGLSTGSARRAYHEMHQAITGRAALEITAAGGSTFDLALLPKVEAVPGVEVAVPLIQRNAIMYYEGGKMTLGAMGIDAKRDAAVRDFALVEGTTFNTADDVLLDASLAEHLKIKVGDEVRLLVKRGRVEVTVVGLVQPRSGAAVSSGGVLFMPLAVAQSRFRAPRLLDRIQVVPTEGVDPEHLRQEIQGILPPGIQVQPPVTNSSMAEETMLALQNGLRLATAFSLLAAVFIIINTFLMNVGQRRRQLAVMRAIGATRRQIAGLMFREALLLGITGTLAGTAIGLGGAMLLNRALSRLFQTSVPAIELASWPLAAAAAFGLGVSILGAWLPARKAARLTPLEGMSGVAPPDKAGRAWLGPVFGFSILAISLGLLAACLAGLLPIDIAVGVTVMLLISLVLLLPLVVQPLTLLCQWALHPLVRVEGRIARRQLLRHGGRTTLTIGVLFVAMATGLGLASSVIDNVEDVRTWYRTAIVGDFFVRAASPDMQTGLSAAIPENVKDEIEPIEGVTGIDSIRLAPATAGEQRVIVVATRQEFPAPAAATAPEVAPESVKIGSVLAQRMNLGQGDTLVLDTREGPRELLISGVQNTYLAGGLTVHMDRALAVRLLHVEGVDAYIVKADHGRLDQVETSLRSVAEKHGMMMQSYADLTGTIEGMMSGVVGSLWGLLVLGLVVAAFGVVNTLGMNVLEQTRELSMLRVVAMTRMQVRKAIVAQAAMLGLLGVVPGIMAGVAMAYIMNLATQTVIGHAVEFALHPWLLSGGFTIAMLMVLAAAWVPAERAARLKLAGALRYE